MAPPGSLLGSDHPRVQTCCHTHPQATPSPRPPPRPPARASTDNLRCAQSTFLGDETAWTQLPSSTLPWGKGCRERACFRAAPQRCVYIRADGAHSTAFSVASLVYLQDARCFPLAVLPAAESPPSPARAQPVPRVVCTSPRTGDLGGDLNTSTGAARGRRRSGRRGGLWVPRLPTGSGLRL